jgi:sugar fermentation stimulation protein A
MRALADFEVPGFGSSDCSCGSHLFGFRRDPQGTPAFQELLLGYRMDRFEGLVRARG